METYIELLVEENKIQEKIADIIKKHSKGGPIVEALELDVEDKYMKVFLSSRPGIENDAYYLARLFWVETREKIVVEYTTGKGTEDYSGKDVNNIYDMLSILDALRMIYPDE